MTTPTDYVMDDSSSFNELRERILAAKQQQNPPAEPDLEAGNEEHSEEETEVESSKEFHNQEEKTQAVQTPVVHVAPEENVQTPVQPPAPENPVEVPWQKEDILAIKEIMQTLNMTANVQLNPFVQEFMRSEEATIQAHIRPSNVKDFIVFMQNRIRALQNESAK